MFQWTRIVCNGTLPAGGANAVRTGAGNLFGDTHRYACPTGFTWSSTSAELRVECLHTGLWSRTVPDCYPVACPRLAAPSNGALSTDTGIYTNISTGQCSTGYEVIAGDLSRTCQADGTWSGSNLVCTRVRCPGLAPPANGGFGQFDGDQYGDTVVVFCDAGYELNTPVESTLRCQANRTWTTSLLSCKRVTCPVPDQPLYIPSTPALSTTTAPTTTQYDYGAVYAYHCAAGFQLLGIQNVMCTQASNWTSLPPTCQAVTCDISTLPSLPNGNHDSTGMATIQYGGQVTWSCDMGYELVGSAVQRCVQAANMPGHLDVDAPNCTRVHCPVYPSVRNAAVVPVKTDYRFQDSISITCLDNHEISNDVVNATATCLANMTWSVIVPDCRLIDCGTIPSIPFADHHGNATTFGSVVTYTCHPGYNITAGAAMISCHGDKTWSSSQPTCTRITCLAPSPLSPESLVTPMLSVYDWNTTVEYSCQVGYLLTTPSITHAQCDSDGLFTVEHPGCHIVQCPVLATDNGVYSHSRAVYMDNVTLTCDVGYELQPQVYTVEFRCLATGSFSLSPLPTCAKISCGPLQPIQNATVLASAALFGSQVRANCNYGFVAAGSVLSASFTCTQNTSAVSNRSYHWRADGIDIRTAGCMPVECAQPSTISNFMYLQSIQFPVLFGSVLNGSCNLGYELTGGDLVRSCVVDVSNNGVGMLTGNVPL
ncbi:CUB and sushi domain-containing protein 1-like [Sycon ciliatum]|uniref:CUB and sushi domain-containing protein 1-like n=1 Tax=Sycon ciliatum TaxID=27933 RepID=UPI0031F6920A